MLLKFRAKWLPKPSLLLYPLGIPVRQLVSTLGQAPCRETVSDWHGCVNSLFQLPGYNLIATVEDELVVAYIHETDTYRAKPAQRLRKLTEFLVFYGCESNLKLLGSNSSVWSFRSQDGRLQADYDFGADVFTVSYSRLRPRNEY